MRIKLPRDDSPLKDFTTFLQKIRSEVTTLCKDEATRSTSPRILTLLLISSYVISPSALNERRSGTTILDELRRILSLQRFQKDSPICLSLCIVRTWSCGNAPALCDQQALRSNRLCCIQNDAISLLEGAGCIVVRFSKNMFLNHAKYALTYIINLSNGKYMFLKYYGSTNITLAGLAHQHNGFGNYEEYYVDPRSESGRISDLVKDYRHRFYLFHIHNTFNRYYSLRSDKRYLRQQVNDFISQLKKKIDEVQKIVSGTTLVDLLYSYVQLQALYLHTLNFIGDLPGRKLTSKITQKALEIVMPPNSLEVEALMFDPEVPETKEIMSKLSFAEKDLRSWIEDYLKALNYLIKELHENYRKEVDRIEMYYDDIERKQIEWLERHAKYILGILLRILG